MHHVTKVRSGPTLAEVRTKTPSKKPILRYLVDRRPGLSEMSPHELITSDLGFLHSPFSLPDIESGVDCIVKHTKLNNTILLYGDRDADGVSSTCLLGMFLKTYPFFKNSKIDILVSSESDPYGLCKEAMDKIKKSNPGLLITLDFGSSQVDEIEQLIASGMDVIVLDHHEVPTRIPNKCHLINPRRLDSVYPEKKICTSVLAFKLVSAILFYLSEEYNKLYEKNIDGKSIYFRNGILLNEQTLGSLDIDSSLHRSNLNKDILRNVNPFPIRDPKSKPFLDDERFLYYEQCKKIPGFLEILESEIDLSGIGTITDMMPLTGENRHVVKLALHTLNNSFLSSNTKRIGLLELLKELKLNPNQISAKDLGWSIGPVINCAGRMGKTEEAVSLLLSESQTQAKVFTKSLVSLNEERRERTKRNLDRVYRYLERKPVRKEGSVVFCYEPDMEPGVSGIVATRMVDDFKKPAIFIAPDNGDARGSIRSFGKENVLDLLHSLSHHFLHFGGHPEAGGFSIEISKIPDLEKELEEKAKYWLEGNSNKEEYVIDTDFTVMPDELNDRLKKEWSELEPFGQTNPPVKLFLKSVSPVHLTPLSGGKHIRFNCIGSGSLKFMIWNKGLEFQEQMSKNGSFDLVGSLEENFYMGRTTLQFIVEWFGKADLVTN
ncbi:MAG: single-stranded-DNA-specific exonuclease RecJ [Leptospira sp.]|nr:single-stranded-DNA-specific exonuclease RecJ [Leptospira sp.]